jgi:hypothetical protein
MVKITEGTRERRLVPNTIKPVYDKLIANIVLNGKNNSFPLKS